eukprot:54197-Eustigmatos_ZCMA.PRE.1
MEGFPLPSALPRIPYAHEHAILADVVRISSLLEQLHVLRTQVARQLALLEVLEQRAECGVATLCHQHIR